MEQELKDAIKLIKGFCKNFDCRYNDCPIEVWCAYFRELHPVKWEVEK